jgi:sulfatase-like protein
LPARDPEPSFLRVALVHGARLAVLSAFAVAQPLLDILGRNPEFFTVRRSSSTQIVLFALFLVFVPPAALLVVELLVRLVNRRAGDVLHLVFVAGFVAVIVLHALANRSSLSGAGALVVAAAIGLAGALLYQRAAPVGSFVTVLAPAPFVFLALFLFDSSASKLVFVKTPYVVEHHVRSRTPVVLVVFDEFAPVSLMDADEQVNAARYPNFAALAHDSTWYRNATTVQWLTEQAVPAVLTGIEPPLKHNLLPIYADHPHNVFTLLGKSYRVRAIESITQLCPHSICKNDRGSKTAAVSDTAGSLASDAGIVYLHLLLPRPYSDEIPAIDDSWGDFGQREAREGAHAAAGGGVKPCGRNICRFSSLITRGDEPTLYVLHSLLPHVPYLYLPSGRRYGVQAPALDGVRNNVSQGAWPAEQAYQRFLLQVEYTDRALGLVLQRLKAKGIYDRALVIVTADHGVSYRDRGPRRKPTPANLQDIAFVPLFVKLPHQQAPKIDDGLARTIDIVPTIAHVLGVRMPWHVDGRSLVGRRLASDGTVAVRLGDGHAVTGRLSDLVTRRKRALAAQVSTFGVTPDSVYRIGPDADLVGKPVAQLPVEPNHGTGFELKGRGLLKVVDLHTDLVPTWIEGRLTGRHTGQKELAIAVNGRIGATTWTFHSGGDSLFAAMVPEESLHGGRNDVGVLLVDHSAGSRTFEQLRGSSETARLARQGGHAVIRYSNGAVIPVRTGALRGSVQVGGGRLLLFSGWAAQPSLKHRADSIALFVDGRQIFAAPTAELEPHKVFNYRGEFGFQFALPRKLLPPAGTAHSVRAFGIRHGVAAELRAKKPNHWRWR